MDQQVDQIDLCGAEILLNAGNQRQVRLCQAVQRIIDRLDALHGIQRNFLARQCVLNQLPGIGHLLFNRRNPFRSSQQHGAVCHLGLILFLQRFILGHKLFHLARIRGGQLVCRWQCSDVRRQGLDLLSSLQRGDGRFGCFQLIQADNGFLLILRQLIINAAQGLNHFLVCQRYRLRQRGNAAVQAFRRVFTVKRQHLVNLQQLVIFGYFCLFSVAQRIVALMNPGDFHLVVIAEAGGVRLAGNLSVDILAGDGCIVYIPADIQVFVVLIPNQGAVRRNGNGLRAVVGANLYRLVDRLCLALPVRDNPNCVRLVGDHINVNLVAVFLGRIGGGECRRALCSQPVNGVNGLHGVGIDNVEGLAAAHGSAAAADVEAVVINNRRGLGAAAFGPGLPFLHALLVRVQCAIRVYFIAADGGPAVAVVGRDIKAVVLVVINERGVAHILFRQRKLLRKLARLVVYSIDAGRAG